MPRAPSKSASQEYLSDQDCGYLQDGSRRKHVCPTCEKTFTTSGHLARHARIHTGERNHKCPFPGCETRCSRQDNLQQHYRIHLAPGSRRGSRSSARKANTTKRQEPEPPVAELNSDDLPPLSEPPALVPAVNKAYSHHSPPPDSPPPLAQATIPPVSHIDDAVHSIASSPETSYSSGGLSQSSMDSAPFSYRDSTSTYHDQSERTGFTYVHTTPMSEPTTGSQEAYPSLPPLSEPQPIATSSHTRATPPPLSPLAAPIHRQATHTSSHIPFADTGSNAGSPPSSHGPPTPTYVYQDDAMAYHQAAPLLNTNTGSHHATAPELSQAGYTAAMSIPMHHHPPYESSPTLAPIHSNRSYRAVQPQHIISQPYLHHPQPISSDYHYQPSNDYAAWKADNSIRAKGIGALVQ